MALAASMAKVYAEGSGNSMPRGEVPWGAGGRAQGRDRGERADSTGTQIALLTICVCDIVVGFVCKSDTVVD